MPSFPKFRLCIQILSSVQSISEYKLKNTLLQRPQYRRKLQNSAVESRHITIYDITFSVRLERVTMACVRRWRQVSMDTGCRSCRRFDWQIHSSRCFQRCRAVRQKTSVWTLCSPEAFLQNSLRCNEKDCEAADRSTQGKVHVTQTDLLQLDSKLFSRCCITLSTTAYLDSVDGKIQETQWLWNYCV
jgi:hypothetical protein